MTRKFTFLLMALLALTGFKSWGQETITVDFESGIPSGWTTIDADGDGNNWMIVSDQYVHGGVRAITSESYSNSGGAYRPDNFLVSSRLTLGAGANLSFFADEFSTYKEHFGIAISTTGNNASDFTVIQEFTTYGNDFRQFNVDLQDYEGEQVYIAFRHYESYNQWRIIIDDITINLGLLGTQYNIAYDNANIEHGSISGPATAYSGQPVKITATPDADYALDHITVNGVDYEGTTFTMPENDATVSATFRQTVPFTVNDGTDVYDKVPFYGEKANSGLTKSQFVIPASYIEDMQGCKIAQLKFYLSSTTYDPDYTSHTWDVYVTEMNDPSGAWWNYFDFGTMTKVYSGSVSIVNNELTITFDEPFPYNDKSLMIGFNQTHNGFYGVTNWIGSNNTAGSAGGNRCRAGWPGNNETKAFLPKTTFAYIPSTTYTVSLTQPEVGGSIDADPKTDVAAGTTVTLSATPATGYELGEWTVVNSTTSEEITITNNQFTMPDSDVTVTATFEALVPHTVTIADGIQHGTILFSQNDPQEYMAGETVYLVVTADDGYFYPREGEITVTDADGNNIDVIIDAPIYSFIMPNSDVTVWAVFNMYYGVQVNEEIVGGSIEVMDDQGHSLTGIPFFTEGADVYFLPIPGDDYEYVEQSVSVYEWDLEQHVIGNPITVDYNSGLAHITMPASDIYVTATFNRTKYNVTQQIVNPSESGYFYIENAEHIPEGTAVVISDITPFYDYQFVSVTVTRNDDQTTVDTYKYNDDYIFYMPDSDVTVTVNFEAIPYYDVTINETENGYAYICGAQSYHTGDEVTLIVFPDYGYIISATDITITPAEGEPFHPTYAGDYDYTFNMPASDVTITVSFHEIQTYTINYYVNGELKCSESCKENETISIYAFDPYVSGVNFEGWGVAPIGTYDTEKPTIIGEEEYPTHNYDLYAVFSYSEQIPATGKDGDKWVEVTSPTDLSDGDQVIIVKKSSNYVMCDRSSSGSGEFDKAAISISSNEITSLPSNAVILTAIDNSGNWKFSFTDAHSGASTLADYSGGYLVPVNIWGGCDTWTIEQDGSSVYLRDTQFNANLSFYSGYFTCSQYSGYQAQLFKKYNPFITNTYYMTEVLTEGEITENTTAKNIISSINSINVKDGATLTMDANGLFRNVFTNLVFEDGAQFYYTGTGTVNATFKKEIKAYSEYEGRDGYYLIANPTNEGFVEDVYYQVYYDLYTFDGAQEKEWINERDTYKDIERGKGYLYAALGDVTINFIGNLLPAGSTEFELEYAEKEFGGFNLIGNPYACNVYLDKPALRLNTEGSDFETIEIGEAIAPCEGFFVEATEAGQSVNLTTEAPVAAPSTLRLTVRQNRGNVIDRAFVNFNGSSNLHKFMLNPDHTNIRLAKNGEEFSALSSEAEGEIPVSFKAEKNGSYTITVNTENVNAHYIHLIDNLTGADVDLLATPSYTFNASTTDYAYRFKLVFSMTDIEENESNANSFAYISNGNLVIDNIEGEATMQIVDGLGRVISTETVSGSYNKSLDLKAGLYIINLNGTTQKIVVE